MGYYEYVLISMIVTVALQTRSATQYWPVVRKYPINSLLSLVVSLCLCFLGMWYTVVLCTGAVAAFMVEGYLWIRHPQWMRELDEIRKYANTIISDLVTSD